MRRHLGEGAHELLVERMQGNFHYTPYNRWEMNEHYKLERNKILGLRAGGQEGIIELVSYD